MKEEVKAKLYAGIAPLLPAVFLLLCCCTEMTPGSPPIYGQTNAVSAADIRLAMAAVQKRLVASGHSGMPIFRVEVISHSEIEVGCGAHYGCAAALGSFRCKAERVKNGWKVTSISKWEPEGHIEVTPDGNVTDIIVT